MGDVQEANKALIRRWIAPADDGSGPFLLTDAARDLLAEDAQWHLPPTTEIPGVDDDGRVCTVRAYFAAPEGVQLDEYFTTDRDTTTD